MQNQRVRNIALNRRAKLDLILVSWIAHGCCSVRSTRDVIYLLLGLKKGAMGSVVGLLQLDSPPAVLTRRVHMVAARTDQHPLLHPGW